MTLNKQNAKIQDEIKQYQDEYYAQLEATLSSDYLSDDDLFYYTNPVGTEFPIIAHTPCPRGRDATVGGVRLLKECGFNCVIYNPVNDTAEKTPSAQNNKLERLLNIFRDENIKVILSQPNLFSEQKYILNGVEEKMQSCSSLVEAIKGNKALGGWAFENFIPVTKFDRYNEFYQDIKEIDKDHLIFFYLDGGYWEGAKPECAGLCDYLDKIQSKFKPDVWSYQCFPFYGESQSAMSTAYGDYFNAFEIYAQRARITQRPFWAFCQCMYFSNKLDPPTIRPKTSISLLRFQIFTALAYGAQGIIYYTYALPPESTFDIFYSALINDNGEKEEAWSYVQQMNRELKALSEKFYGCQVWDVRIAGSLWRSPCTSIEMPFGPLISISKDINATFSLFGKDGGKYLFVVNRSLTDIQQIIMKFSEIYTVKEWTIDSDTYTLRSTNIDTKNGVSRTIKQGDFLFFSYENNLNLVKP